MVSKAYILSLTGSKLRVLIVRWRVKIVFLLSQTCAELGCEILLQFVHDLVDLFIGERLGIVLDRKTYRVRFYLRQIFPKYTSNKRMSLSKDFSVCLAIL
jgi:hypothetical protein